MSTATDVILDAHTEATAAGVILNAWHVYRRSQQIPFHPALSKAQRDLFRQVDAFTRTSIYGPPSFGTADTDAIDDAIDALVAAAEWHCGPDAAAHVSGDLP